MFNWSSQDGSSGFKGILNLIFLAGVTADFQANSWCNKMNIFVKVYNNKYLPIGTLKKGQFLVFTSESSQSMEA